MLKSIERLLYGDDFNDSDDYVDENVTEDEAKAMGEKGNTIRMNMGKTPDFVFARPVSFEDAFKVADAINDKQIAAINLENASAPISHRIVDFLSGVAYTNRADFRQLAKGTYVIVPAVCKFRDITVAEAEEF